MYLDAPPRSLAMPMHPKIRPLGARSAQYGRNGPELIVLLALDLDLPTQAVTDLGAGRVVRLGFDKLDARRLAETMPGMVAMPLWSPAADAVQMLQMLAELGYAGPVHVFAPPLPDRRMVIAELKAVSPLLRISLVEGGAG